MARIRTIKPGFFLNEVVSSLPFEWRLLFVGLWTQADRDGRLEDRPQRLKAALFPYDDLNIDHGLGSLANAGLIIRYEVNGQRLISIPTWSKHQQPHIREAVSELPPPCESTVLAPDEPVRKGREGKGTGREGVQDALRARFDRFWAAYPRKQGKDVALKEWLKRAPSEELTATMIVAVQVQCQSLQWQKDGGQFIPQPRTWLHQGRWQDEVMTGKMNGSKTEIEPIHYATCPHDPKCGSAWECQDLKRSR